MLSAARKLDADTSPPPTRADCEYGLRPCPWTSCRYYLGAHAESCALDVAEWGGCSLSELALIMGVSKQRAAQLVARAFRKLQTLVDREARRSR